jgi:hypothetical protein
MNGVFLLDRPAPNKARYLVPSNSMPGLGYIVLVRRGASGAEVVECPCLAWIWRQRCRHKTAVLAHLAERQQPQPTHPVSASWPIPRR